LLPELSAGVVDLEDAEMEPGVAVGEGVEACAQDQVLAGALGYGLCEQVFSVAAAGDEKGAHGDGVRLLGAGDVGVDGPAGAAEDGQRDGVVEDQWIVIEAVCGAAQGDAERGAGWGGCLHVGSLGNSSRRAKPPGLGQRPVRRRPLSAGDCACGVGRPARRMERLFRYEMPKLQSDSPVLATLRRRQARPDTSLGMRGIFTMIEHPIPEALTFDDVLLVPALSEVVPAMASTQTRLTRTITLNTPLLSAAMDTVTESRLAIAMAQQGGLGVIHRNLSIEQQAAEVDKVKRSESGMIVDPVTISPDQLIEDALEVMRRYKISGVPVTQGKRLVGILTNRDLRFETRTDIPVSQVMTKKDLITVPVGTTLEDAEEILHHHRVEKLRVVNDAYELKGLITVKDIQKKLKYPNASKDEQGRLRVGAAIGATGDYLERAGELVKELCDALSIDSAHGHSTRVLEAVRQVKKAFPHTALLAGNVATYEGAMALIDAGADAIKVGIGPGSICTTRMVTGAGMPQITAISEAYRAGRERNIPIIADGGIKYSGDLTKAIAAGADAIMIGSLFAGVDESPGETILYQGRTFKAYRGMGSLSAMAQGSGERYFQSSRDLETAPTRAEAVVDRERNGQNRLAKFVPEGIEGRVPHRGPLEAMVHQLVGGLRSGMGYLGCNTIEELKQNARFVRISNAGLRESHVHDVIITREAPNYHVE
jgi:IMP dehydrogenase